MRKNKKISQVNTHGRLIISGREIEIKSFVIFCILIMFTALIVLLRGQCGFKEIIFEIYFISTFEK